MDDEFRTLRRRQEELRSLIDRQRRGSEGTAKFVGKVFNAGAMPSTVPGQFAVHPVVISGTESEGSAVGATVDTGHTRIVTVLGPKLPVIGDMLSARLIDGRWVAEHGGGAATPSHPMSGCPCALVPDALSMAVAIQPTNGTNSVVFPATFAYGPKPADLGAYRADNPGWYSDTHWSTNGWYKLRYHFGCAQGLYFVKATTTADSPLPVPEWSVMTWLLGVGSPPSTCSPFSLPYAAGVWHNPEGQNNQHVSISG